MDARDKARLATSVQTRVIANIAPDVTPEVANKLARLVIETALACGPSLTKSEVEEVIRRGFYNSL